MFFLFGADQCRKQEIGSYGPYVCGCCGSYGRYHVYRTYSDVSLFFVPVIRWNKVYYAETTCCGSLYELSPDKGKRLLYWDEGEIRPQDLKLIRRGRQSYQRYYDEYGERYQNGGSGGYSSRIRRCAACGYTTQEDFEFCPKCGQRLG